MTTSVARSIRGWTVARSTLANERVSIGGARRRHRCHGRSCRSHGCASRAALAVKDEVGRLLATSQTLRLMNMRRAERAVAGSEPGPEGTVTKLVLAEHGHALASITLRLLDPRRCISKARGQGRLAHPWLPNDGASPEALRRSPRNQIGERILGLRETADPMTQGDTATRVGHLSYSADLDLIPMDVGPGPDRGAFEAHGRPRPHDGILYGEPEPRRP